ncbi:MAG TPA: hypothetical protein VGF63_00285 [Solirubrobacteraceae bacterium]|jgi:hypothetical protein
MTPQTTNGRAPATRRRRVIRALVPGGLVAVTLAVAACGSTSSPTILNTEKVERAIEASSLAQRHKHVHVSCPSGVHQKKGLVFACVTLSPHGTTRFVVTELDGAGHVHYQAP